MYEDAVHVRKKTKNRELQSTPKISQVDAAKLPLCYQTICIFFFLSFFFLSFYFSLSPSGTRRGCLALVHTRHATSLLHKERSSKVNQWEAVVAAAAQEE